MHLLPHASLAAGLSDWDQQMNSGQLTGAEVFAALESDPRAIIVPPGAPVIP